MFDLVPNRMYPEFEKVPPNHMRIPGGPGA